MLKLFLCVHKNYIEMREAIGQQGQRLLIATAIVWRFNRDNKFSFVVAYSFSKSTKEVISVQGARHSPNTLSTKVYGQTCCITTWQSPTRGISHPPHSEMLSSHVGSSPGNLHQYSDQSNYFFSTDSKLTVYALATKLKNKL